jgi:hypothetical protein
MLTRAEIVDYQLKSMYYNFDEKYFHGHKCKEKKIFMVISENILDGEVEALPYETVPPPIE